MAEWTDEDEGLLRAYLIREHLRQTGQLPITSASCPLQLELGERCLVVTNAQLSKWQVTRYVEDHNVFRIRVKWAKDPLMAPFLWLFFLPFNLMSMLISRAAHTKSDSNWAFSGDGPLALTDHNLLQATYGGQLRFPLAQVTAVDVSEAPRGINFRWRNENYSAQVPAADRLSLVLMMRYLALGNRGDDLMVPGNFIDRARTLGRL
jgi:hypothetical protein